MIVPLFVSSKHGNVAVLTPRESYLIRDKLNNDYKKIWDFLLYSRARIIEAEYLSTHPECFKEDHRALFLPRVEGLGKDRCTIKHRSITLSDIGVERIKAFYADNIRFPMYTDSKTGVMHVNYAGIQQAFVRAAIKADFQPDTIKTKMLRKTYISWMFSDMPEHTTMILMTAGHTADVARGYYLSYGFRREDIRDMRTETAGMVSG